MLRETLSQKFVKAFPGNGAKQARKTRISRSASSTCVAQLGCLDEQRILLPI